MTVLIRIGDQLQRIANSLERFEPAPDATGEPACQHPDEHRLALGTVGDGWQCMTCGYLRTPAKVE